MKEIVTRFKANTPRFFKRIRNISLLIAAACGAAIVAYTQLPAEMAAMVPAYLAKTIAFTSVITAFVAQLTKEDK